jgi:hypothetical protein
MYSNLFRIIGQGIDDKLDVRSGGVARPAETTDYSCFFLDFFFSFREDGRTERREKRVEMSRVRIGGICRERSVIQTTNDYVEPI